MTVNLRNSVVGNNVAADGGGGVSDFSEGDITVLNATDTTFSENHTQGSGGGIYAGSSIVTLVNSAIISNTADADARWRKQPFHDRYHEYHGERKQHRWRRGRHLQRRDAGRELCHSRPQHCR